MNPKQTPPPPASGMSLSLEDIYYIIFRRKWVILGVALLGFIAAGVVYDQLPTKYKSFAEVYIPYITQAQPVNAGGSELHPVRDPGAAVLNSELQIIKSLDLAKMVAENIGPAIILGNPVETNAFSTNRAAIAIQKNLQAQLSPASQIITLTFSHQNPAVASNVLAQLITNYISVDMEIHNRSKALKEYLDKQTLDLKKRLRDTEEAIAKLKGDMGVVDLAEGMKAFTTQEAMIKQENYLALAELDDDRHIADQLKKMIPGISGEGASTNAGGANKLSPPTDEEREAYAQARQHLADLLAQGVRLQSIYSTNNPQVATNLIEIAAAKAKRKAMEEANPGLLAGAPGAAPAQALDPGVAYTNVLGKIAQLQWRITRQTGDLANLTERGTNLLNFEVKLREKERSRALDEQELIQTEKKAQTAAADSLLEPDQVSNLSITEQPTPPFQDEKKLKLVAGIAGGGVALGLGLAFLLEMLLDRSLRRPKEVASKLGLPFFLSVPYLNGHGPLRLSKRGKAVKLLAAGAEAPGAGSPEVRAPGPAHEGPVAPWDENHALRPFHEALRDRLIAYFEAHDMTHKPKLVALTSCHRGAGVSTMASGLACLLSETGEGNVLLVNMNSEEGDAHRFYKGKLNLGLEDIFEKEKENREHALVQENLYVVKESSQREKLPGILPKRFSHLVSKMKASDYDYIIFDMPPVTPTSITPRLARFMDMVLLVVESEETDREVAQQAAALLSESRTNLGVVMNKNRSYVPRRLLQEFGGKPG